MVAAATPYYYLEHFESLLDYVQTLYGAMLSSSERAFLSDFGALSVSARCLYVRMCNRRGMLFRRLHYPEIESGAVETLRRAGFVRTLSDDEIPEAIAKLTCEELGAILRARGLPRRGKKEQLVFLVLESLPEQALAKLVREFVALERYTEVELFKLLYFGTLDGDMAEFVVRDVGHVRTEDRSSFVPRFSTRKAVDDLRSVELAYREFRRVRDTGCQDALWAWFEGIGLSNLDDSARPLFSRLVGRTGRILERAGHYERALSVYRRADEPPSRERRARVLKRLGRVDEALAECERILANPRTVSEQAFAEDFSCRLLHGSRRRQTARFLADSEKIRLPRTNAVEADVASSLVLKGLNAAHTENVLWRSLFVLVLWEAIYDPASVSFHTPLQRGPSDLFTPDFYLRHREAIELELASYTPDSVRQRYAEKHGIAAPLMSWDDSLAPLIFTCLEGLDRIQVSSVLREIARDVRHHARGFPDLFVWGDSGCEFIEVKSPNDQLSAQQLHWLRFFNAVGIRARAIRVLWEDEPA
ncbi:MAG: VRR-NUC domain-containing protein [Myxococcota bacterium]